MFIDVLEFFCGKLQLSPTKHPMNRAGGGIHVVRYSMIHVVAHQNKIFW